jgi:uncharacterized protein YhbP (UPF0306 family)
MAKRLCIVMRDKTDSNPTEQGLKNLAEDLIKAQSTMTLATARENIAWTAPVYYVNLKYCFYFFSDPASRHIQESLAGNQASSAIYAPASTWQEIRGIQMSGVVETTSPGLEAIEAVRAYLKKFAFTKDFFSPGQALDLSSFTSRFRVKLYRFKPTFIYYMDNSIRFGFREKVCL